MQQIIAILPRRFCKCKTSLLIKFKKIVLKVSKMRAPITPSGCQVGHQVAHNQALQDFQLRPSQYTSPVMPFPQAVHVSAFVPPLPLRAPSSLSPRRLSRTPPPSPLHRAPPPSPSATLQSSQRPPSPLRASCRRRRPRDPLWASVRVEAGLGAAGVVCAALAPGSRGWAAALGPGFFDAPLAQLAMGAAYTAPFVALFAALSRATGVAAAGAAAKGEFRQLFGRRCARDLAVFCGAAAVGEELLFRGFLQAGLAALFQSQIVAVAVSSVVFGSLHGHSKSYTVLATLAGVLFGGLYVVGGESVLPGVVVHFVYDLVAIYALRYQWMQEDARAAAKVDVATVYARDGEYGDVWQL